MIFGAVAYVDGQPAGFIVNTAYPGSYVSMGARLSPLRFAWELGLAALSRPGRIVSALRARTRMKIAAASASSGAPGASAGSSKQFAEGLFLGVKPEYTRPKFIRTTGCNVARDLLRRSLDLCAAYRVRELRCGIMRDNMAALVVHFQAGFQEDGERLIGATAEHAELSVAIEPAVCAWAAAN